MEQHSMIYGANLGSQEYQTESLLHHHMGKGSKDFRCKLNINKAVIEQNDRLDIEGTFYVRHPLVLKGTIVSLRLERLNWLLDFDYKQMFNNEDYPINGKWTTWTGTKTNPTLEDDTNNIILGNVNDLYSLCSTHDLATVVGFESSLDYRTKITWKKNVTFYYNEPEIQQWIIAIGLDCFTYNDQGDITGPKYYATDDITYVPINKMLIRPDAVIDLIMERNDIDFVITGDNSAKQVLGQFIARKPIGEIIAYNADDDSEYFRSVLLGKEYALKLYHHWLGKQINKLTLNNSIIDIELRGRLHK